MQTNRVVVEHERPALAIEQGQRGVKACANRVDGVGHARLQVQRVVIGIARVRVKATPVGPTINQGGRLQSRNIPAKTCVGEAIVADPRSLLDHHPARFGRNRRQCSDPHAQCGDLCRRQSVYLGGAQTAHRRIGQVGNTRSQGNDLRIRHGGHLLRGCIGNGEHAHTRFVFKPPCFGNTANDFIQSLQRQLNRCAGFNWLDDFLFFGHGDP